MSDSTTTVPVKRRPRKQYTYRRRTNAIDITLYSLQGETIPASIRNEFRDLATQLALKNNLVINIATS
jgi:hypothetical protein